MAADANNHEPLRQLQSQVAVAERYGLVLLAKTQGNVGWAAQLFRQETLARTIAKIGVSEEMAARHLAAHQFNLAAALQGIDEELYSVTERILRRCKDKQEDALHDIALAIAEQTGVTIYWTDCDSWAFRQLQRQRPACACVLAVLQWLDYESWETFEVALHYCLPAVLSYLRHQLRRPGLAMGLWKARQLEERLSNQLVIRRPRHGMAGKPDPEYLENLFQQQRPALIAALYRHVQQHLPQFP
jgi:hypothetical protein